MAACSGCRLGNTPTPRAEMRAKDTRFERQIQGAHRESVSAEKQNGGVFNAAVRVLVGHEELSTLISGPMSVKINARQRVPRF